MRVYLDNVAACGRVISDLEPPEEMAALEEIERAHAVGQIKRVTSRESWREQERTQDPAKRARFEAARSEVSVVAHDHIVLGFSQLTGQYGTVTTYPNVTDIVDATLYADLRGFGLDEADARHLMYAAANACDFFVTLDPHFLTRRESLEARCPAIRIVRPSELAAELRRSGSS